MLVAWGSFSCIHHWHFVLLFSFVPLKQWLKLYLFAADGTVSCIPRINDKRVLRDGDTSCSQSQTVYSYTKYWLSVNFNVSLRMRRGITERTAVFTVLYVQETGPYLHIQFLGAFANVRKTTASFFMCLSVRMEQHVSHWTDFHEIWYSSVFRKICWEISVFIAMCRE